MDRKEIALWAICLVGGGTAWLLFFLYAYGWL